MITVFVSEMYPFSCHTIANLWLDSGLIHLETVEYKILNYEI